MKITLIWFVALILMNGFMFVPYIYERVMRAGFLTAQGYSEKIYKGIAPWAQRCKAAHMNALEGLVVFAPLVFIGLYYRLDLLLGVQIYFFARLVHYLTYAFAIPYLRTLAFFVMLVVIVEISINLFCALS